MERVAVYPGSFDPITNGHIDIVKRGLTLFDRIIIAIMHNPSKKTLFSIQERMDMIQETFEDEPRVEVDAFGGLLVDYAEAKQVTTVLRGMRAVSDFDYEFQLALMNRHLDRKVQTIFLMTSSKWLYISSSIVKEAARFGGDVSLLVPKSVHARLVEKISIMG